MNLTRRTFLLSLSWIPGTALLSALLARPVVTCVNLDDVSHSPVAFPCKHCGSFERIANDNSVENIPAMLDELFKALESDLLVWKDRSELRIQCTGCPKHFVFCQIASKQVGWRAEYAAS